MTRPLEYSIPFRTFWLRPRKPLGHLPGKQSRLTHVAGHEKNQLECDAVKTRKKKKFEVATEARRRARASGLAPATTRVIPDKRKRPPKHRKDLLDAET
ncbi:MAG TPA: hypothetical protein VKQ28_11990 [Candidatus Acidoferrum sp.]|nr:hypothetical protein [Candidatus Acidoferrum sp.]